MPANSNRNFAKDISKRDKEKDKRLSQLETSEYSIIRMVTQADLLMSGEALAPGATYTSADMRAITDPRAKGIIVSLWMTPLVVGNINIYIGSSDTIPTNRSARFAYIIAGAPGTGLSQVSQTFFIPLGTDGMFKMVAAAANGATPTLYMVLYGWFS